MAKTAGGMHKTVHSAEQLALRRLLIEARSKAELTQQQLARKLRKPQSFVAKYEGGERRIDVIEFIMIVRAIGADPVYLVRALTRRMAKATS